MHELYLRYEKNNFIYELTRFGHIVKITRNKEIIHIQFDHMTSHKDLVEMGFKNINYIVGNFAEYVSFCENYQPYMGMHFEDDEWARHTKIYAEGTWKSPEGEPFRMRRKIGSVKGEMANNATDKEIKKYEDFISNPIQQSKEREFVKLTLEELKKLINETREKRSNMKTY